MRLLAIHNVCDRVRMEVRQSLRRSCVVIGTWYTDAQTEDSARTCADGLVRGRRSGQRSRCGCGRVHVILRAACASVEPGCDEEMEPELSMSSMGVMLDIGGPWSESGGPPPWPALGSSSTPCMSWSMATSPARPVQFGEDAVLAEPRMLPLANGKVNETPGQVSAATPPIQSPDRA